MKNFLPDWAGSTRSLAKSVTFASGTQEIQDRPGLKKLLEDAAKGDVEVLLCSDLTRLTRSLSSEIIGAIQKAGVQIVTTDGTEIGFAGRRALFLTSRFRGPLPSLGPLALVFLDRLGHLFDERVGDEIKK